MTEGPTGVQRWSPDPTSFVHLDRFVQEIRERPMKPREQWHPIFVRLFPDELPHLKERCTDLNITILDPLHRQLEELAEIRLPAGGKADRSNFVEVIKLQAGDECAVGFWVFLPWCRRIIHVLERADFLDVITDRNREKIAREDQRRLFSKRIGVVGLSVGAEAAVSLAQENLCGSIHLADLDHLDLSNLNRLGSGIDGLGINKSVLAARRILRINPYMNVTIFPEGVNDRNLDDFLSGLDLLVDECDGTEIKWELRTGAIERGLNVIFAGDERGFLSVEPYAFVRDLEPFHGRLSGRPAPPEAYRDKRERLRELTTWLGGWEAISEDSRRSLEQVGETVSGYPQLASEARFAAGVLGHVARRLLLGERLPPFLGHIDLEELLPAPP